MFITTTSFYKNHLNTTRTEGILVILVTPLKFNSYIITKSILWERPLFALKYLSQIEAGKWPKANIIHESGSHIVVYIYIYVILCLQNMIKIREVFSPGSGVVGAATCWYLVCSLVLLLTHTQAATNIHTHRHLFH